MARRSEIRQYQDSYRYLFKGGGPVFSVGGSLAFQYNEKWRFESGLYSTPYSNTVAVFYNEPGYRRLINKPMVYVNPTNTLEIPLKVIYNPSLSWRSYQLNFLGGFHTYLLAGNIDARGEAGLPGISVSPSPPTNLSVIYNTYNLSEINFGLEAGAEIMRNLGSRFVLSTDSPEF